jgi:hypothetical protein
LGQTGFYVNHYRKLFKEHIEKLYNLYSAGDLKVRAIFMPFTPFCVGYESISLAGCSQKETSLPYVAYYM